MLDMAALERLLAALTFQGGYNSAVVLSGATLLGIAAGVVGTFIFLRRRALISDAMAHATLPGIAVAFLIGVALGWERSLALLLIGAGVSGTLSGYLIQLITRYTRLTEDTAIGAVLSVSFALGVVLLSYIQTMNVAGQAGLQSFILGQAAAMREEEAYAIAALAAAVIIASIAFFKEFRLVCFDADFAYAQGWPVFRVDLLMALLTVLVTIIGLQSVGLILIIALLIVPPVTARFWSDSLTTITVVSGAVGGLSAYGGVVVSAAFPDMPTGAVIVLNAGLFFVLSLFLAPQRGLLAQLWGQRRRRWLLAEVKVLSQHLTGRPLPRTGAMGYWLRWRGWVDRAGMLTSAGRQHAVIVDRNLRLWEALLREQAGAMPHHARWGVDPIQSLLPTDLLRHLEKHALTHQQPEASS